jgi:hypothetical protein
VMKREPLEHIHVRTREPADRFHADQPLEDLLALRRGALPPPLSLRFQRQGGLLRALDTHAHSPLEHLNLKRSVALVARAWGED